MVIEARRTLPRSGLRKLYHLLLDKLQVLKIGRDKFNKILKANNLLIQSTRSYHITTNSHHRFRKHKNLIADTIPNKPNQIWVSDITYLGKRDSPLYLALVTDMYSKKIVGYNVSTSLSSKGATEALLMAISTIRSTTELNKYGIKTSMTESYDPYANAIAERINGILKQGFMLDQYHQSLPLMKKIVEETVNIYNNVRPHYSCYYKTPGWMHGQSEVKIKTYKRENHGKKLLAMI